MNTKKINPEKLRRRKALTEDESEEEKSTRISSEVGMVIDLAFNPTRDKIREVTIIDRLQGRLFPQLDMINYMRKYCLEIAHYRQDPEAYKVLFKQDKPIPPEPLDELLFRTAQWQKSVAGRNLERATDIALAETESRVEEEDKYGIKDVFKDEE